MRDDSVAMLSAAGIRVGLTVGEVGDARNLRWEAGYAVTKGLPFVDALAAVTRNVADMFGITNVRSSVCGCFVLLLLCSRV